MRLKLNDLIPETCTPVGNIPLMVVTDLDGKLVNDVDNESKYQIPDGNHIAFHHATNCNLDGNFGIENYPYHLTVKHFKGVPPPTGLKITIQVDMPVIKWVWRTAYTFRTLTVLESSTNSGLVYPPIGSISVEIPAIKTIAAGSIDVMFGGYYGEINAEGKLDNDSKRTSMKIQMIKEFEDQYGNERWIYQLVSGWWSLFIQKVGASGFYAWTQSLNILVVDNIRTIFDKKTGEVISVGPT